MEQNRGCSRTRVGGRAGGGSRAGAGDRAGGGSRAGVWGREQRGCLGLMCDHVPAHHSVDPAGSWTHPVPAPTPVPIPDLAQL